MVAGNARRALELLTAVLLVIVFAGLGIVSFARVIAARNRADLSILAGVVAQNSTGGLAFNDRDGLKELLLTLKGRLDIIAACLYYPDNALAAEYSRSSNLNCPNVIPKQERWVGFSRTITTEPILLAQRRIGTLLVVSENESIFRLTQEQPALSGVVGVSSGALGLILSRWLRRRIVRTADERALAAANMLGKAMNPLRLQVFLCHCSEDKAAVRALYYQLRRWNFTPWLDEVDLLPGQEWREEIPRAVQAADVVIVCLSEHSLTKKGYVQREIKYALDVAEEQPPGKIFIIPVRLTDCQVPDRLSKFHWVNLFETGGVEKLAKTLKMCGEQKL